MHKSNVSVEEILGSANSVRQYGIFSVSSLSYYPSASVHQKINHLLGIDFNESKEDINRLMEQDLFLRSPDPLLKFGYLNELEANFSFYAQEDIYYGVLDIKGIYSPNFRNVSIISLIPKVVLNPFQQKIDDLYLKGPEAVFYILDTTESKWEINCHKKKKD